jgi:hypothetical protein
MAKEKNQAAKIETLILEGKNDTNKATKSDTELVVEKAQEVDPSMDFLSTSKKIAMQKIYSKDPTAILSSPRAFSPANNPNHPNRNTEVMYGINRKTGAQNLYMTTSPYSQKIKL